MGFYMFNATVGHADLIMKDRHVLTTHDGLIRFRSDSPQIRVSQGDEFTTIMNNPDDTKFFSEKVKLFNKGYINKLDTPLRIPTNELLQHELEKIKKAKDKKRHIPKFYYHQVRFVQADPFNEYSYLDDYSYSLIKVYKRYVRPIRHFSKIITEISTFDFETFKKERIFIDRTIFGRLINALPYPNRLQFLLFCIEEFQESDLTKIPFAEATPFLKKFVKDGIINIGKYLNHSLSLVENNTQLFSNAEEVLFQDEKNRLLYLNETKKEKNKAISYNLKAQSKFFTELFNVNNNFDNLFSDGSFKNSPTDEVEFQKIFNRRPWPVDLN